MKTKFLTAILALSISLTMQAQQDRFYEEQWKLADSLITHESRPESALTIVKDIYTYATGRQSEAQAIKALLYMQHIERKISETEINAQYHRWDTVLQQAFSAAQQSIIHCVQAAMLHRYYNENNWRFYQRSETIRFVKEDIATWTETDFHQAITDHYLRAVQPAGDLFKIKLDAYDAIILQGNLRNLRPTLYDLLANEALEYFKSGIANNKKPEYAFQMDDPAALSPLHDFVKKEFTSLDTGNAQLKALQLYQQLLAIHQYDENPDALIDVDINRIGWIHSNSVIADKAPLYLEALQYLTSNYPDAKRSSMAWYHLAAYYKEKGDGYDPLGDTTQRYVYLTVKQIAAEQLKNRDTSNEGHIRLQNLVHTIETKSISTEAEQVNLPNLPFRMLIKYKNIATAYIRIIKVSNENDIKENRWDESYWQYITKLRPMRSVSQVLPETKDLQQHSTEIKIDALTPGTYIILTSTGKQFNAGTDRLAAQYVDVSAISYISEGKDFFVLHRHSGQPLAGVQIRIESQQWDQGSRRQQFVTVANKTTDSKGHFILPVSDNNYNGFRLTLNLKNDKLVSRTNAFYYVRNNETPVDNDIQRNSRFYFYTDRSIYRPGQTVYFKALGITQITNAGKPVILKWSKPIEVMLKDVNGKPVDTLSLALNEFGSINGKFQLPQSALTGRFTIDVKDFNGNTDFNVEEYKRPTFYVTFDTIKNDYRLGDSILVTGTVKGYAGNNIDGALVSYTVNRNTRFIYDWWYWGRWPGPRGAEQQLAHGFVRTDADGKFTVPFIAQADKSIDKKTEPAFDFGINVSVTDNAGETRDGNTAISLGYKSLLLELNIPKQADVNAFSTIKLVAKNFNGEEIPATVRLTVSQLNTPDRLIRNRLWNRPDVFVMNKSDYMKQFPNDEYDDETNPLNWKKASSVFSTSVETGATTEVKLSGKLSPGYYLCEASTTDKDGNAITNKTVIALYDVAAVAMPSKKYQWEFPIKQSVSAGEAGSMLLASAAQNVYLIENSMLAGPGLQDEGKFQYSQLSNGQKMLNITMQTPAQTGGLAYAFVKHNRFHTGGIQVTVPDSSHDLKMEISSYRTKTLPGSKEQWSVTIKGSKGEQAAAELLTAMYDASLDAFQPHNWQKPTVWSVFGVNNYFSDHRNFVAVSGDENYLPQTDVTFDAMYDQLATNAEAYIYGSYYPVPGRDYNQRGDLSVERTMAGAPVMAANAEQVDDIAYSAKKLVKDAEAKAEPVSAEEKKLEAPSNTSFRKNFNETAFFLPEVYADANGDYRFEFTMPDALTQWKWLTLAHTKEMAFAYQEATAVTQKELMVQSQLPRFFREGDRMDLSVKISNLSDTAFTGTAQLSLIDAITNEPVDGLYQNTMPDQYFTAEAGQSTALKFPVVIPYNNTRPVIIKVSGIVPGVNSTTISYADGEENTLPVLSNRMLVTESLPMYLRGNADKTYSFDKLKNNQSPSLTHQSLTVEYTTNPAWYVVQAIPYMSESTPACAEAIFNQLYINTLAQYTLQQNPEIKSTINEWRTKDTAALMSALEKNEELKQIILQETPWVLDALNETAQKKRIAALLTDEHINSVNSGLSAKLKEWQLPNGAFAWMKGGYEDRYMTQYILTGIGKLFALKALDENTTTALQEIASKAIEYVDAQIQKDYENLLKYKADLKQNNTGSTQVQYLYMRSFFKDKPATTAAYNYFYNQCKTYWAQQSVYMKALTAFIMYRNSDKDWALKKIIPSLIENAVKDVEAGMYYKNSSAGYYWYENPVEQQALLISLFNEMYVAEKNQNYLQYANDMQAWLIRNKQTNNWKTSRATADACYALISSPAALLKVKASVDISAGNKKITITPQAATGYIKQRFDGAEVSSDMGIIKLKVQNNTTDKALPAPSFGAVYWQYFEDLDKITPAVTPLSLKKQLFIERNTVAGVRIEPLQPGDALRVGDKVKVRIELRSDRDMEYMLLKDMRAAALEPVNVLSNYKWQDGLGYYESVKDASTDFFISFLPKGTYVFEYAMRVTQSGSFSNGTATIQCYYAPEFTSHSEGININVDGL